ncbi:unnamed protein product [Eruca vesicaria subsp. sativa]|uniref:Peptidyl-prolyl cis-trans isomerase n=1 Tax=Eruca vesicaria subsp. sativa TaxID=29727 RepID=A0ABC8JBN9_ERUVS|nr:unnamed protein product [Eruca vesicaria subsp. sativa]
MLRVETCEFQFSGLSQVEAEYSECPSGKKGGDLGWFSRGKMAGPFQDVAFNTPVGVTSAPFKSTRLSKLVMLKRRDKGLPKKGQGRRVVKRNK